MAGRVGRVSVLYDFNGGVDGANPSSGVIFDQAGNLCGTLANGYIVGAVFELTPFGSSWTKSLIYHFTGKNDGSDPNGGVIFDSAGNLYGTTTYGGANGGGTVYELSPANRGWNYSLLYSLTTLNPPYWYGPLAGVIMGADANLYGTTFQGGQYGGGAVFKLTYSDGIWRYTSLHDFSGGSDGVGPECALLFDDAGNLYGTTFSGGVHGKGVVWEITP